ncbi:MAG: glycosyltransferase family 39 protein [candidate division WOR-3 bacterium]
MKKQYLIYIIISLFFMLNILNLKNLTLIDWDEGVYALQAEWLASNGNEGKPFNFQTPPLFQITIALFFKLIGYNGWVLNLISIVFSCLTIYITFLLGKKIYNDTIGLISVFLFISSEYFLFFSKSGLSDATFAFFFISAIYFFYRSLEENRKLHYILCGFFTTLTCYTKYTGPVLFLFYLFAPLFLRKKNNKYLILYTLLIPILILVPYYIIFLKFLTLSGIKQRYGKLLGLHHLKHLYYLFRFAPIILTLSIFHRIKEKKDYFILSLIAIFFIILGFYHHYFRLSYPLILLFLLFSACVVARWKKIRYYITAMLFFMSIIIAYDTMLYHSPIPSALGKKIDYLSKFFKINYILAIAPPNILFYIPGNIMATENSVITYKFMQLDKRETIRKDDNLFKNERYVLVLSSNIFPQIDEKISKLTSQAIIKDSLEFVDAPIYYKDPFNELGTKRQIYKIYVFELIKLGSPELDTLWKCGFYPGVVIIKR